MVEAASVLVLVELHGEHGREQRQQLHEDWVVDERLVGLGANAEAASQHRRGQREGENL